MCETDRYLSVAAAPDALTFLTLSTCKTGSTLAGSSSDSYIALRAEGSEMSADASRGGGVASERNWIAL